MEDTVMEDTVMEDTVMEDTVMGDTVMEDTVIIAVITTGQFTFTMDITAVDGEEEEDGEADGVVDGEVVGAGDMVAAGESRNRKLRMINKCVLEFNFINKKYYFVN